MKKAQILLIVFCIGFIACNGKENTKIKSFIGGTYVRSFEGGYSKGNDTLVIEQPDINTNYYTIQHRSAYQKIRGGLLLPVEYKMENWTAIFNEQSNVLEEQKKGKIISFLPDEKGLLLGNSRFQKIE